MDKETQIRIEGAAPLLMHNGTLADPMNPLVAQLAEAVSRAKKSKADEAWLEAYRVEWRGGLYLDASETIVVPTHVLEAAIVEGAKKRKLGKQYKGACLVEAEAVLEYDGPSDLEALWADPRFSLRTGVRVGQNRVMRVRPCFPVWALEFTVLWDSSLVKSEAELLSVIDDAGKCGIGDWRPRYGRFVRV